MAIGDRDSAARAVCPKEECRHGPLRDQICRRTEVQKPFALENAKDARQPIAFFRIESRSSSESESEIQTVALTRHGGSRPCGIGIRNDMDVGCELQDLFDSDTSVR